MRAIVVLQATLSLWTVESREVVNVLKYPLDIDPRWFRGFFLWVVPLGCVIFLGSSLGGWRLGVRHDTSTGR